MANYNLIENMPLIIRPVEDFSITGWLISTNKAFHDGCNADSIGFYMDLSGHESWNFTFEIIDMTSGGISLYVDGVGGKTFTKKGVFSVRHKNSNPNAFIQFHSEGKNCLSRLQVYPETTEGNGKTFVFNEDVNKWTGEHSYHPEYYHKFLTNLFSFKNGTLWVHDASNVKNNFYGRQYSCKIRFAANANKDVNKRFMMMKIDSNNPWRASEITAAPNQTYPTGMKSMLSEKNFSLEKGEYWASFLRDMNDPQFSDRIQSLFEGRELEGKILIIELECLQTTETQLNEVYVFSTEKFRNF